MDEKKKRGRPKGSTNKKIVEFEKQDVSKVSEVEVAKVSEVEVAKISEVEVAKISEVEVAKISEVEVAKISEVENKEVKIVVKLEIVVTGNEQKQLEVQKNEIESKSKQSENSLAVVDNKNDNFAYSTNLNIENNLKRKIELFICEFTENISTLTDKNPQLIKKNKFVAFETKKVSNSSLFLRFLEIDMLIYQQFPELSIAEIRKIRIPIVEIFSKHGFIKSSIHDNSSIKDSVLRMFLEKNNFVTFRFKKSNAVTLRGLVGVKLIKSVF